MVNTYVTEVVKNAIFRIIYSYKNTRDDIFYVINFTNFMNVDSRSKTIFFHISDWSSNKNTPKDLFMVTSGVP